MFRGSRSPFTWSRRSVVLGAFTFGETPMLPKAALEQALEISRQPISLDHLTGIPREASVETPRGH